MLAHISNFQPHFAHNRYFLPFTTANWNETEKKQSLGRSYLF